MSEVSGNRPAPKDRRRKAQPTGKRKGLALVKVTLAPDSKGGLASCSCGAESPFYAREKPREDWIDKHIARAHKGRGVRV